MKQSSASLSSHIMRHSKMTNIFSVRSTVVSTFEIKFGKVKPLHYNSNIKLPIAVSTTHSQTSTT